MAIRTYKVTLDSKNTIAPEPVFLRQGDKTGAVVIDATLMDNGYPVSLSGLTPMFKANTADGQAVIADSTGFNIVNASGGEFTYRVSNALSSVPGKIKVAYFSFVDSSGAQSTFNVVFVVEKAVDMTQESAKDWVSNLNEIIDQYNQWVNNAHSSWQDFVNENKEIIESIDPGGTLLAEIIDARNPKGKDAYTTLGERLDNMPFNESVEIDDTYNDVDGGIRDYFVYQLKQISGAVDKSKFNLGFGTDYHYDVASNYFPYPLPEGKTMADATQGYKDGLRKLLNITAISDKLDAIVINGDNVDQPIADGGTKFEKAVMLKEHRDFANVAYQTSVAPIFVLKGNHDCNYNQKEITLDAVITNKELDDIYKFSTLKFGESRKGSSNYFYRDFADKKVRLIGLDTYDLPESETNGIMDYNRFTTSGLSQSQLNWLANDALQVDSETTVLIITHHPINHTLLDYDDDLNLNHDMLQTILDDFKNGVEEKTINSSGRLTAEVTYSFKDKGHIAGVLTGHRHIDSDKIIGGINYIETRCSLTTGDNMIKSERLLMQGTINEDCFDLVAIDSNAKTINLTRFGIGASRQLNFE